MLAQEDLNIQQELEMLSDAMKYDISCASNDVGRKGTSGALGNMVRAGLCHSSFAGRRCISLLGILFASQCIYDCKCYINWVSNDAVWTPPTPEEIYTLTMEFYRRNYIEELLLSPGILHNANYTMGLTCQTLELLRQVHHFYGYIHVKAIPGADVVLVERVGLLMDRMNVDLGFPTAKGLKRSALGRSRSGILTSTRQVRARVAADENELIPHQRRNRLVLMEQSTQMIVGATLKNDFQMIHMAEALYKSYDLKRVSYSTFIRVNDDSSLPALPDGPPLLRKRRLYQVDWLMRFHGFQAGELLSEEKSNFNVLLGPGCDQTPRHLEQFPVEVNRADYYALLCVPGMGMKPVKRVVAARKSAMLDFPDLKKIGVVLEWAVHSIICNGRMIRSMKIDQDYVTSYLVGEEKRRVWDIGNRDGYRRLSLSDDIRLTVTPTVQNVHAATIGDL